MTWGIVTKAVASKTGWALIFFGAISFGATGTKLPQNTNGKASTRSSQAAATGKNIFELRCATCHGLDGFGGEHAPDIVRHTAVKTLSEQALLQLIHDGIPEAGMPGFPEMGKEDSQALVAYLRFLQGKSGGNSMAGDPVRGHDLFFGKVGCATCHSRAGSISEELIDFARDHAADEIAEAILNPASEQAEAATAVATDGQSFSGVIRNEDNASLQLQDENGRFFLLMKSNLVSVQRKSATPMPTDYSQRLNTTELNDLVGYILREARVSDLQAVPTEKDSVPNAQH